VIINIGIIGCGYWGPNLIRNFSSLSNANVISCCDINDSRLKHIKEIYRSIKTTKRYQDLLSDPKIDAVIIATPINTHYKIAKEALENGKHILVEKPLTDSSKKASELVKLSKKNKKILMVDHTFEYSPPIILIKKLIKENKLGKIYSFDSARLNLGLFQSDINVLWDLAPHDISILVYLLDETPSKTICIADSHISPDIEDNSHIFLNFKDNKTAHIHISWLHPTKVRRITIVGSKRMLIFDDVEPFEKIKLYDKGVYTKLKYYDTYEEFLYKYRSENTTILKVDNTEPLKLVCEHFLNCITRNIRPKTNGITGLKVVKIVEDLQKSLDEFKSDV